ncbi:glycosyltransferase [Aliikangiella marina]|uniref:Glycosyltransferase n=1 Tax=Aliikangiella marina TaxID=1712262 RepID=A0A545T998_9GAMM|nr:glycosyltransferase [Aliikangiella marina]TQV73787.1 glycosyltransferase [Aliikangiella marina]
MKFSIVVPLYNKVKSVEKTILSILNQTHTDFELIVVDDGSTDGSDKVVELFEDRRLTLIRQPNQGVSAARNTGIRRAQYSHIAFIDADDCVAPDYLKHICRLIYAYPEAGAYCTRYRYVNAERTKRCKIHNMKNRLMLFDNYFAIAGKGDLPIIATGVCIPKYVLDRVGQFPVGQVQGEDQDLWARIGLNFSIAVHPAYDIDYCLDAENRVSVEKIPRHELPFSERLQALLYAHKVEKRLIKSVKRYIAGHLIHLAQLNLVNGRKSVAMSILKDPRTNYALLRKLKWRFKAIFCFEKVEVGFKDNRDNQRASVDNLLNDKKMGGILSVVKSLSESSLANDFQFTFNVVDPTSLNKAKTECDMLMVHYASSWKTLIPNLILRIKNWDKPLILQEHHYTKQFYQMVPSQARFRLMLKLNYSLFDNVVSVSHGQARWMKSLNLVKSANLTVIPQSRKLDDFLSIKPKKRSTMIRLVAYGRLSQEKGFDRVIKAFRLIESKRVVLDIAGDGPMKDELIQLASGDKRIKFVGRVNDVPALLSRCDAVIIPSRFEAFGLVCLEAKAAGKAVIVADVGGLSEQVSTNNNTLPSCGLKLDDCNPRVIAEVLNRVDLLPLEDWGRNGRMRVKEAWYNYQKQWSNLLSQFA